MELLSSQDLVRLTGLSYRQIDFWIQGNVFCPVGESRPGSGRRRQFDPAIVPKLVLLRKISKTFGREHFDRMWLKRIYDNYEAGNIELITQDPRDDWGPSIRLSWDV